MKGESYAEQISFWTNEILLNENARVALSISVCAALVSLCAS